jgi:hypothetical protein
LLKARRPPQRGSVKWLPPILIIGLLLQGWSEHLIVVIIALILLVDMGFTFTAIDSLIAYNNRFYRWLRLKFSSRKK